MRLPLFAALLLAGCASPAPPEEPPLREVPGALISHAGVSFYVLEGRDDLLDDGNDFLIHRIPRDESEYDFDHDRIPESKGVSWMGEQGLHLILRWGLSKKRARLLGHADFQPVSGYSTEMTLFDTDPKTTKSGEEKRIAFRVRLKATKCKNPDLVSVEWEVGKLTDGPAPEESGRPGQFPRVEERIHVGSGVVPFGATLMWFHREEGPRGHYLLLRLSSLERP